MCPTPPTAHQSMSFDRELDPTSARRAGVAAAGLAVLVARDTGHPRRFAGLDMLDQLSPEGLRKRWRAPA